MKALLCAAICAAAISGAQAATAYEALRTLGKERGEAMLDRVLQVRGSKGVPQPKTWRIRVLDSKARGGVREFGIEGTRISDERPDARRADDPPLNMNELNLDSDGAHTMAEREAKKAGFAYDHVSYTLQSAPQGGAPVWELRLVDEQNGRTAVLAMAADSGKLLSTQGLEKGSAPPRVAENRPPRAVVVEPGDEEVEGEIMEDEEVFIEERRRMERREIEDGEPKAPFPIRVGRFFDRAGRHIGGAFRKFGEKVDRAFDAPPPRQVKRNPAPARTYRDKNGTEYYRPRD